MEALSRFFGHIPENAQALVEELLARNTQLEAQNESLHLSLKEAETQRDRYVDLYQLAPAGYLTLDSNQLIIDANKASLKLLGLKRHRLIGRRVISLILPDCREAFYFFWKDLLEKGSSTSDVQMAGPLKSTFHAHISGMVRSDPDTGMWEVRATITDITERVHAEEQLSEMAEKLRDLNSQLVVSSLKAK